MLIGLIVYTCMSFPAALVLARVIGKDHHAYRTEGINL